MKKKFLLLVMAVFSALGMMAQSYYVAGSGSKGNPWCDGENWNPSGSLMSGNPASITFNGVPAGAYEFKVTDGSWANSWGWDKLASECKVTGVSNSGGNIKFIISGTANITITYDGTNIKLSSSIGFGEMTITIYTVVGEEGLCGVGWAPTNTVGDMTLSAGVWKKVYTGIAEGTYKYKVVGNHNYSAYQYPASGDKTVEVPQSNSTVTITFDPATETLDAQVTSSGSGGEEGTPTDITVKIKRHIDTLEPELTWDETISVYMWTVGPGSMFTMTAPGADGWYSCTFSNVIPPINIIFLSGTTWPEHTPFQTKNIEGVMASTCYEIGDYDKDGDWKRFTTVALDCPSNVSINEFYEKAVIYTQDNQIVVLSKGAVQITDISSRLFDSGNSQGEFISKPMQKGIYMVSVDGKVYKIAVK